MDYQTVVSIANAFTDAGYEAPEGFYFVWSDIAIFNANFDESMHESVDPTENYGDAYTEYVESIKELTPVIFGKLDTDKETPFSLYTVDAGDFQIYPQGGGPILRVGVETFHQSFEIHAINLKEIEVWSEGQFSIEESPSFEGYHNGRRWNGWETPHFELEVAKQVAAEFGCEESTVTYNEEQDAFVIGGFDDDEDEIIEGVIIEINGEPKKVYGLGAYSWIWSLD